MAILWRILGIGTLLTALVAGGLFVCDTFVQANAEQEIPIETLPVETRDIEEIITCLGEVEPAVATEIKSEVTGRVSRVLVESGIEVQRGDPLVELDQNELLVEIEEAEHHIEASQLRLAKVKLDLDSKEELKTKGFLPAREFADAEIDYKLAENELKIQRARVQALKERLTKTTIRAPQASCFNEYRQRRHGDQRGDLVFRRHDPDGGGAAQPAAGRYRCERGGCRQTARGHGGDAGV
ncbi:MAG: biotin/lipoyl-binding protein [Verrucomicrobiales bacterium]